MDGIAPTSPLHENRRKVVFVLCLTSRWWFRSNPHTRVKSYKWNNFTAAAQATWQRILLYAMQRNFNQSYLNILISGMKIPDTWHRRLQTSTNWSSKFHISMGRTPYRWHISILLHWHIYDSPLQKVTKIINWKKWQFHIQKSHFSGQILHELHLNFTMGWTTFLKFQVLNCSPDSADNFRLPNNFPDYLYQICPVLFLRFSYFVISSGNNRNFHDSPNKHNRWASVWTFNACCKW